MLECFTAERPALRNSELADRVGISRSTAHRYATTLMKLGYLEQDHKRRYRFAPGARQPDTNAIETIRRAHPARAILEDLRSQTGHTISLGMLDGDRAVYIHRLHAHRTGQFEADGNLTVGTSVPARDTAIGKALLSCLLNSELQNLLPAIDFHDQLSPTHMDGYDTNEINTELKTIADVKRVIEDGIATGETACARSNRRATHALDRQTHPRRGTHSTRQHPHGRGTLGEL
jgi:DNA-binding IclR family transcriptional regulator